jgi:hypothetical protein
MWDLISSVPNSGVAYIPPRPEKAQIVTRKRILKRRMAVHRQSTKVEAAGGKRPGYLVIMFPSDVCGLARFPPWKRSCCPIADVRRHVCCGTLRVATQQNGTEYRSTASRSGGEAVK